MNVFGWTRSWLDAVEWRPSDERSWMDGRNGVEVVSNSFGGRGHGHLEESNFWCWWVVAGGFGWFG
jgi:hypothetical protein